MADDEDDDEVWGAEISGGAAPKAGVTKDTMRKARRLNPELAKQGSTTELLNMVKGGQSASSQSGAAKASGNLGGELGSALNKIEEQHKDERKRAQEEIAKLQKLVAELGPKSLERVLELIMRLDPNLTSPLTQELLKSKATFLNDIGFSVRKVLDRQLNAKK
jgi:hypothetical protein